jgi:inner membrane protein
METTIESIWTRSKLLIKSAIIFILILLLLIPASIVQDLVGEREARQREAIAEVSSKWAGQQIITGPMLAIPYLQTTTDAANKTTTSKHTAYFLPDDLKVEAAVTPQQRSRGIYKVMLYTAQVHVSGSFASLPIESLKLAPENILWKEAYVIMNIADVKGLNDELK